MYARSDAGLLCTLFFVLIVIFSIQPFSTFAQTCTGSRRPIQLGDIERAAKLGITIAPGTPCVDKNILGEALDANTEQDIAYLSTKTCPGMEYGFPAGFDSNNAHPDNWNQIREGNIYFSGGGSSMNPGALKCFREFFEMAEQAGFQPCISAALRTPAHQRSSCHGPSKTVCGRGKGSGPNGCPTNLSGYLGCPHVKGYGMDINDKNRNRLHALLSFARQSGKFSMVGVPGTNDIWHIEAASCGNPNFNPNPDLRDNWSGVTSPTSSLFNSVRGALGIPTQQAQPFVSQPAYPSQPASVAPLSAFENTNTNPDVSSQITGSVTTSGSSSAANRLEELAFGPIATSSRSATSVPIVISGANASFLFGNQQASTSAVTPTYGFISPQTTFISGDLSWQNDTVSSQPVSGIQAILITIRATLLRILHYLTPFGNRTIDTYGELGE